MTARDETYRATVQARIPDEETTTLIVTRQGRGHAGRVWLTLMGSIRTTVVLTDTEVAGLIATLTAAVKVP